MKITGFQDVKKHTFLESAVDPGFLMNSTKTEKQGPKVSTCFDVFWAVTY